MAQTSCVILTGADRNCLAAIIADRNCLAAIIADRNRLAAIIADRNRLTAIIADRNRPQKHVQRARIILHSGERLSVLEVARRAGASRPAVWRAAALCRRGD